MEESSQQPGIVEDVAPTPVESEAQAAARALERELVARRELLDADQLASLIAPRAHFEQEFARFGAYFFTVDGVLMGRKVVGAMFAGEVILVYADNFLQAQDLANRGLRETVRLLHEEYLTREFRLSPMEQGMAQDAAGRRGRSSEPGRELSGNPKLKAMLAHVIGGLPWKW